MTVPLFNASAGVFQIKSEGPPLVFSDGLPPKISLKLPKSISAPPHLPPPPPPPANIQSSSTCDAGRRGATRRIARRKPTFRRPLASGSPRRFPEGTTHVQNQSARQ